MAASFFLAGQFEEVLVYLTSIKSYLHSGDKTVLLVLKCSVFFFCR